MGYILAIILPPLAVFTAGAPIQGIFNALLFLGAGVLFFLSLGFGAVVTFPMWVVAVLHALFVVHGSKSQERIEKIATEVRRQETAEKTTE